MRSIRARSAAGLLVAGAVLCCGGCFDWLEGPSGQSGPGQNSEPCGAPIVERNPDIELQDVCVSPDGVLYLVERDIFRTEAPVVEKSTAPIRLYALEPDGEATWRELAMLDGEIDIDPSSANDIEVSALGDLYCRNLSRLFKRDNETWRRIAEDCWWFDIGPEDEVICGDSYGCFLLEAGVAEEITPDSIDGVFTIIADGAVDPEGRAVVVVREWSSGSGDEYALLIREGETWLRQSPADGMGECDKVVSFGAARFHVFDQYAPEVHAYRNGAWSEASFSASLGYVYPRTWCDDAGHIYFGFEEVFTCRWHLYEHENGEAIALTLPYEFELGQALTCGDDIVLAYDNGAVFRGDGTAWTRIRSSRTRSLRTVATRDGEWWAGGDGGLLLHLDAAAGEWREAGVDWLDLQIFDMALDSAGRPVCLGAQSIHGQVLRWDGDRWEFLGRPFGDSGISCVWVDGEDGIWCANDGGLLYHERDGDWESIDLGLRFIAQEGIWRDGRHVVVGSGGTIFSLREGEEAWSLIQLPCSSNLRGVDIAPDGTLYVVGTPGMMWCDLFGGRYVHVDETLFPNAVGCSATGEFWVATGDGELIFWDGVSEEPALTSYSEHGLYDLAVDETGRMRAVGHNGLILASPEPP